MRNMATNLEKILDEFICTFKIGNKNNFEIKEKINTGFSDAEVYLIELANDSTYIGKFFLKIDTDAAEYDKSEKGYCFSNIAKIIATPMPLSAPSEVLCANK